ncbi:MAG: 50S ribosomal protein L9 [Deltaproteobacteria bacterium]|uniref:Large ribosomal subunit protein bL9 n=1 Tax=Candidatus Zymogenus saltonus TaxID=2844893 RepID=A0A9D8KG51_9DELT|nr:50S ribosomal protein L9 [Candidatus Zymogenus saltonus]
MEIILLKDVNSLGKTGDKIKVAPGYARNYLIPKKLALKATKGNLKRLEEMHHQDEKAKERDKASALVLKEKIEALRLTMIKPAGEEDKLFGSVTSTEIAAALSMEGIDVDKKKIVIDETIKRLGDYTVSVKLFFGVVASLKIEVVREG